jgi:hypothetical protein
MYFAPWSVGSISCKGCFQPKNSRTDHHRPPPPLLFGNLLQQPNQHVDLTVYCHPTSYRHIKRTLIVVGFTLRTSRHQKLTATLIDQYLQIALYDMNIYVGNVSTCFQSRVVSLLMNLNRAIEQALIERETLPNFDLYMLCEDRPPEGGTHGI